MIKSVFQNQFFSKDYAIDIYHDKYNSLHTNVNHKVVVFVKNIHHIENFQLFLSL